MRYEPEPPHSPADFAATDPDEVALTRRRLLRAALVGLGGASVLASGGTALAASRRTTTTAKRRAGTAATCRAIVEETGGPFPADGSNGLNVLTQQGVVRSDIRASFGSSRTVAAGIPLTVRFSLRSAANGCAPLKNAAFYAWHCDKDGNYSMYSPGFEGENYLRGVGVSDGNGDVVFQAVYPGAYPGRWPHIHFEVYPSLARATSSRNATRTSQLAFPKATCEQVYRSAGYETSADAFPRTPLESDNVLADGWTTQMATVTGDTTKGLVANLVVTV